MSMKNSMNSARTTHSTTIHKNSRVIFIPRPDVPLSARRHTIDAAFEGLKTPPAEREPWQIDAIHAILSQWPDFTKVLKNETEQREIIRCINMESHKPNKLLFKPGDYSDGWYLVFSGECTLYTTWPTDDFNAGIPQATLHMLYENFGEDKFFKPVKRITAKHEFGSEELKKDKPRTLIGVVNQPSLLLRIDPYLYRMTVEWLGTELLTKRTDYLSEIPELEPLKVYPPLFNRLAEILEERTLPVGIYDWSQPIFGGFMVITSGSVRRKRFVDFSEERIEKHRLMVGDLVLKLPSNQVAIPTDHYGEKHLIADPFLSRNLKKPFLLQVLKDSKILTMKYHLVQDLIPIDILREVESKVLNEMTNSTLIEFWINQEKAIQWNLYRKRCMKEARQFVKMEKTERSGDFPGRKPKPPKSFKQYKPFRRKIPVNPHTSTETI